MIDWFIENAQAKTSYQSLLDSESEFHSRVERMMNYEVLDMRFPNNPGKTLDSVNDFAQLMRMIYQIRCNLFHGKKSLDDPHDVELVEIAYDILTRIFAQFVE